MAEYAAQETRKQRFSVVLRVSFDADGNSPEEADDNAVEEFFALNEDFLLERNGDVESAGETRIQR